MGLEACFWMDNEKGRQVYAPLPALLGCVVVDCVILCFFDSLLLFCYQVFKCFVLPHIRIWFRYSVVFWCVTFLCLRLQDGWLGCFDAGCVGVCNFCSRAFRYTMYPTNAVP